MLAAAACGDSVDAVDGALPADGASPADAASGCAAGYVTSFDLDEAEISEGGRWRHHPDNVWQRVRSVAGRAMPAAYTEIYDDAYAYLACWDGGDDYEVTATAFYGGTAAEAEILLRVTDTASTVRAYEFLYNTGGSWQFVRWNGPLGDFTVLDGGSTPSGGDGRQVRARIVGSTVDLFWRADPLAAWDPLATVTDGALPTGQPGLSFYAHAADQTLDKVGFSDWAVTLP